MSLKPARVVEAVLQVQSGPARRHMALIPDGTQDEGYVLLLLLGQNKWVPWWGAGSRRTSACLLLLSGGLSILEGADD